MYVVIDTNVFVMTITSKSPYHQVFLDLIARKYTLLVSTEVVLEYEEVITLKYGEDTTRFFLALLSRLPNVIHVEPSYQWQLISKDPDDNKYVDCAVAGQADFLVSEDRHFDVLAEVDFPKVKVLKLDDFFDRLTRDS